MILMGDEFRRTQLGNNNAYCQDNPISWLDWTLLDRHPDLYRFVKQLIASRLGRELAAGEHGLTLTQLLDRTHIQWHGVRLNEPDWGEASRSLAYTVRSLSGRSLFHLIANAFWEPLGFELPEPPGGRGSGWRLLIDTARDAPDDIAEPGRASLVPDDRYLVQPRSVVLLLAQGGESHPGEH
jgi:glycogen operon protein